MRAAFSRCSLAYSRVLIKRSLSAAFFRSASFFASFYYFLSFYYAVVAVLARNSCNFLSFSAILAAVLCCSYMACTSAYCMLVVSETKECRLIWSASSWWPCAAAPTGPVTVLKLDVDYESISHLKPASYCAFSTMYRSRALWGSRPCIWFTGVIYVVRPAGAPGLGI